jgi:hypothetical protein
MSRRKRLEFVAANVIAAELGVTPSAFGNWRARRVPGMPEPDGLVRAERGTYPVWLESSLPAWRKWHQDWKAQTAGYRLTAAQARLAQAKEAVRKAAAELETRT